MPRSRNTSAVWTHEKEPQIWSQSRTFKPLVALLVGIATKSGKRLIKAKKTDAVRISSSSETGQFHPESILMRLSDVDREAVLADCAIPEAIIEKYAHEIHSVIRSLYYATHARIVDQRDMLVKGKINRQIKIEWGLQLATPLRQLRRLQRAAESDSAYKWDKAWLGLTDTARRYLSRGLSEARRRGALRGFRGELERPGEILPAAVPTPEFALLAIPHAIEIASKTGRPPKVVKLEALAGILDIFVALTMPVTGDGSPQGGAAVLLRDGVPFVHEIENIFSAPGSEITLLPEDDAGAMRDARRFMKTPPGRASGRKRTS